MIFLLINTGTENIFPNSYLNNCGQYIYIITFSLIELSCNLPPGWLLWRNWSRIFRWLSTRLWCFWKVKRRKDLKWKSDVSTKHYKFNRKKGKDIYSYKYTTIHIFIKVEFPPRISPEKNNGHVLFKNIGH